MAKRPSTLANNFSTLVPSKSTSLSSHREFVADWIQRIRTSVTGKRLEPRARLTRLPERTTLAP